MNNASEVQRQPNAVRLCEHLMLGGKQCGSPAMRGYHFCYHHRQNRRPRGREVVGNLHSRRHVQRALSNICQALVSNRLSSEDAGRLIYGIATAMRTIE